MNICTVIFDEAELPFRTCDKSFLVLKLVEAFHEELFRQLGVVHCRAASRVSGRLCLFRIGMWLRM